VLVMLYIGPYRNPGWFTPGFTILIFLSGTAAVTTGEYIREAVRKPYVSYNVVMSNQILPEEIPSFRNIGYLQGGVWTKAYIRDKFPNVIEADTINEQAMTALPEKDQVKIGGVLFQYHCNDCHAVETGYSSVGNMIRGWDETMIGDIVRHPEKAHFFMPPWSGTEEEAKLLTKYLVTIAPAHPSGMYYGNGR
jgi:mono/diheme cytochrome c family protein